MADELAKHDDISDDILKASENITNVTKKEKEAIFGTE